MVHATGRTIADAEFFVNGPVVAISAPVYVSVDGQRTWKRGDVESLAEARIADLDALAGTKAEEARSPEYWQADDVLKSDWSRQLSLLQERIDQANAKYEELIELAD